MCVCVCGTKPSQQDPVLSGAASLGVTSQDPVHPTHPVCWPPHRTLDEIFGWRQRTRHFFVMVLLPCLRQAGLRLLRGQGSLPPRPLYVFSTPLNVFRRRCQIEIFQSVSDKTSFKSINSMFRMCGGRCCGRNGGQDTWVTHDTMHQRERGGGRREGERRENTRYDTLQAQFHGCMT